LLKKPGEQVIGCVALRWSESWTMEAEARQILTALAPGMAIMVDNLWSSAQRERTLQLTEAAVLRLTDELRVKAALLEEANRKLEAFTYSVSHDLRAQRRAQDGFSRILTDTYREQIPDQAVRYLDRVRANATQMGALIDGLLTLSRVDKRHLETRLCDMRTTAQRAFQEVQEGHETESVTFILSDLPPCQGDPEMVAQVFAHLLSNAVKFSRGRPEATIEVGVEDKAQGYPVYFVRDNGIGFDMEYANKIFGVFQRLHDPRQHEGTGVGLAIVNRIIYRHGGRIWVSSVPNVGTTFYFTLEGERDARSAS
jgi:light-regulated signal transduction histidine kinase (bacteriophytochrome)